MKNLSKWQLIVTSVVILLPILVGLLIWNRLPEAVPFHWNVNGEVDQWVSRGVAVFVLPFVMLAFHWLCIFVTSKDPRNKDNQEKALTLVVWIVPVLTNAVCCIAFATAIGCEISVSVVMALLLGVMFMVMGNYLPKCKPSFTIGIRLPWTLKDDENWRKTHRFAGILWVIGGAIITASAVFNSFVVLISAVGLNALAPVVYSYLDYRRHQK